MSLPNLYLGLAVFACCGKPHVIYASKGNNDALAESQFAETLANARATMGEPKQTMFNVMPPFQAAEIISRYLDMDTPQPEVHMIVADSPADLEAKLRELGVLQGDPFEAQSIVNDELKKH